MILNAKNRCFALPVRGERLRIVPLPRAKREGGGYSEWGTSHRGVAECILKDSLALRPTSEARRAQGSE